MANTRIEVLQGSTVIATRFVPSTITFEEIDFKLTAGEVASVTNWDLLFVEIVWAGDRTADFYSSQVELLVPTSATAPNTLTVGLDAVLQATVTTATVAVNAVIGAAEVLVIPARQRPKWHFRVEPVRQIEIVRKARVVLLPTPPITRTATVSLDAILGSSLQKTVALTGVIQAQGLTKTVALTGFLTSSVQKTVALTGVLQALGVTKTVSLDALLGSVSILTVNVNAVLQDTVTATVALTGVLQEQGLTLTVALAGVVQQQGITNTVALNALLSQPTILTVALAGSLSGSSTIQVPCTAVLTGVGTLTFTTFWARTRKR